MIRVLVVDDQVVVCEGLRVILNAVDDLSVVGVANNGAQALEVLPETQPDVVLMDLKMPGMNGIHATRAIREAFPQIAVLVLTTYDDDEWVFDAIRAGAAGYLLKDSPREAIIAALREAAAGRTHIDPAIGDKLFAAVRQNIFPNSASDQDGVLDQLNDREREILRLLAHGLTNGDIAEKMHLAEGTVRNYVSTVMSKLDVGDRTQAAAWAWRHGLARPDDA